MGKETRGINLPDLVQVLFLNIRVRLYAAVCSSAYDHYVSLKRPALFLISATLKNSRFPVKVQQFSFFAQDKNGDVGRRTGKSFQSAAHQCTTSCMVT